MSTSGIAGSYDSFISLLRNLQTVLHRGCNSLLAHQQFSRVPFSSHPIQHLFVVCSFFDDGRSNQCEVILQRKQ